MRRFSEHLKCAMLTPTELSTTLSNLGPVIGTVAVAIVAAVHYTLLNGTEIKDRNHTYLCGCSILLCKACMELSLVMTKYVQSKFDADMVGVIARQEMTAAMRRFLFPRPYFCTTSGVIQWNGGLTC